MDKTGERTPSHVGIRFPFLELNVYREGREMPVIIVEMYTGRTAEQKAALAQKLTEGTIEVLGVRPDQVRVIIHDLPKEDYAVGGKTIAELQREMS